MFIKEVATGFIPRRGGVAVCAAVAMIGVLGACSASGATGTQPTKTVATSSPSSAATPLDAPAKPGPNGSESTIVDPAPTVPKNSSPTPRASKGEAGKALKTVEELPGYGKKLTAQERAMMRASTVKVVAADLDDPGDYYFERCTGLKVAVGGKTYVLTARHCFENSFKQRTVFPSLFSDADNSTAPDLHSAKNITSRLNEKIGVWTANSQGTEVPDPTARAIGVSVSYYPDMALLRFDPKDPASSRFNKSPTIPYDAGLSRAAVPGAETSTFSIPDVSGGTIIESRGVYLGRVSSPYDPAETLDLIGINPHDTGADACNYGASGASAIIAGGFITGPLSIRNSIPKKGFINGADDRVLGTRMRKVMAKELGGLDLTHFSTICGYGVVTSQFASSMARAN